MKNRLQPLDRSSIENGPRLSRRELIMGALLYVAHKGVRLNEPPIILRQVTVGREAENMQLVSEYASMVDRGCDITITPVGELLVEPSGEFFTPGREFDYVHRGGK